MADETQGATATATAPAAPDQGTAGNPQQWQQAAQTLQAAQHPNPETMPQTQGQTTNDRIGGGVPLVLRPKQTGLAGVVGKIADVLAGTTRPEIYTDEQGNEFVYHPNLTRGQQWQRIAGRFVQGAAAGLAGGKGAGNMGRGLAMAAEKGEQSQQQLENREEEMNDQAQKDMMNRANNQILRMNMAEQAWRASRLKVTATQQDVDFANQQIDRFVKSGGQVLGTASGPNDIGGILKVNPTLMEDMIKRHQIELVPSLDTAGHTGLTVIKMPQGYRDAIVDTPTFHTFDPIKGALVPHQATDPMTQGEIDDYDTKAHADQVKFKADQAEADLKAAETGNINSEKDAREKELPGKIAETEASTREKNAQASKARSEVVTPGGNQATTQDISEGLASGRYLMGKDVPLRTSKDQTAAAEYTRAANAFSMAHYGLPYAPEIIRQEAHFAEQPKTQAFLNGIDRMIGTEGITGQLDEVLDYAKRAGITQKGGAVKTPFSSLRQWVKERMGDEAAKAFETKLSDTQTALGTLIGNPLLGSGESDKKLKTAQEQFGKDTTIENLQSTIKSTKEILERGRQTLARNNRYIQQRYGDQYSPRMVSVQIPGQPPGQIPASALEKFKRDNPTAQVSQ